MDKSFLNSVLSFSFPFSQLTQHTQTRQLRMRINLKCKTLSQFLDAGSRYIHSASYHYYSPSALPRHLSALPIYSWSLHRLSVVSSVHSMARDNAAHTQHLLYIMDELPTQFNSLSLLICKHNTLSWTAESCFSLLFQVNNFSVYILAPISAFNQAMHLIGTLTSGCMHNALL